MEFTLARSETEQKTIVLRSFKFLHGRDASNHFASGSTSELWEGQLRLRQGQNHTKNPKNSTEEPIVASHLSLRISSKDSEFSIDPTKSYLHEAEYIRIPMLFDNHFHVVTHVDSSTVVNLWLKLSPLNTPSWVSKISFCEIGHHDRVMQYYFEISKSSSWLPLE